MVMTGTAPTVLFHVSLILFILIGIHDFLQLCVISLAVGLALLTHLLKLLAVLLSLRCSTRIGIRLLTWFHAMMTTMMTMTTTRSTYLISILGVEFQQLSGLLIIELVLLDNTIRTMLDHLCLVRALTFTTLLFLIILCESGRAHHHGSNHCYYHLFHIFPVI